MNNRYVCLEHKIKENFFLISTPHISKLYNFPSPDVCGSSVKDGLKDIVCINMHIPSLFDRLG